MEDLESQSGAETIPGCCQSPSDRSVVVSATVLSEDVQALLHAQGGVEDDEAVADR